MNERDWLLPLADQPEDRGRSVGDEHRTQGSPARVSCSPHRGYERVLPPPSGRDVLGCLAAVGPFGLTTGVGALGLLSLFLAPGVGAIALFVGIEASLVSFPRFSAHLRCEGSVL